eukprot:3985126-Pyramimonas_sp.AAC.1
MNALDKGGGPVAHLVPSEGGVPFCSNHEIVDEIPHHDDSVAVVDVVEQVVDARAGHVVGFDASCQQPIAGHDHGGAVDVFGADHARAPR